MNITNSHKTVYGSSVDRTNSFDDSLEIATVIPLLTAKYPDCEVLDKPYGEYGIDVVVRRDGEDIVWVELERSMGWSGEFNYPHLSFLERKYHFVQEARDVGAKFIMCWFERDHAQLVTVDGNTIERYQPIQKTLRSGVVDTFRHINIQDGKFYTI